MSSSLLTTPSLLGSANGSKSSRTMSASVAKEAGFLESAAAAGCAGATAAASAAEATDSRQPRSMLRRDVEAEGVEGAA